MASCAQVDSLIQAYVDGELRESERAILEQHLAGCAACRKILQQQRAAVARLFEALAPNQLNHDLAPAVMAHLPHMDNLQRLAHETTWRVKNPRRLSHTLRVLVPVLTPVVLLVLGFAIYWAWPEPDQKGDPVGMVVHRDGAILRSSDDSTLRHAVALESRITAEERFETDDGATLMIALSGPSQVKMDRDTRVKVVDPRAINVESGRVWLDICSAREKFRVATPMADIIVFGTQFSVEVLGDRTVVIVSKGTVTVERDERFCVLQAGEQVVVTQTDPTFLAAEAPEGPYMAWAEQIQPDPEALRRFGREMPALASTSVVRAHQVYRLDVSGRNVEALTLTWDAAPVGNRSGYDVYVFDDHMNPLVHERVSAAVFNDPGRTAYELVIMPDMEPISGMNVLNIKTVPDFSEGFEETSFREIATHVY